MNLLVVFDAMIEHRSVTRAAEAIGLSQPAMSAAVSRLRGWFDDPLAFRAMSNISFALSTSQVCHGFASGEILKDVTRRLG